MKRNARKHEKGTLLENVAHSIGATLGTLAAKAGAAGKTLTQSSIVRSMEREGNKLRRGGTSARRKNLAARNRKRGAGAAAKRAIRRKVLSSKPAARRGRGRSVRKEK